MIKEDFIKVLKDFRQDIKNLEKECQKVTGNQLQSKALLNKFELTTTKWFDQIEPTLRSSFSLDDETILKHRQPLGKILELIAGKPYKRVMIAILKAILRSFNTDILVPVQMSQAKLSKFPHLSMVLSHANGLELDYLAEAIDCAHLGKRRAAIILGWCAAVNRLHLFIEKEGFTKFNEASVQMSSIQTGRYKRINKKYDIQNLSDLRMSVFDKDLLWVLEYLEIIDGNQHERLEICNTMRNTCAHPGESNVSDENVLSFFSDIDSLILNNPKFIFNDMAKTKT